jgi:chromosome segregation ATPase
LSHKEQIESLNADVHRLTDAIANKDKQIQTLAEELTALQTNLKNSDTEIQTLLQEKAEKLLDIDDLTEAFERRGQLI